MMHDMKSDDDLVRIAAVGGGLDLRQAMRSIDDFTRIAAAAKGKGAQILISGHRSTDEFVRIGAAGGCVVFHFD